MGSVVRAVLLCALLCVVCGEDQLEHFISRAHFKKGAGPFSSEQIVHSQALRTGTLQYLYPSELWPLYNLTYNATAGAGKTIAIIDAFGASTAEADLAAFNTQFALPACTTANGCFKKVNQTGGTVYPPDDTATVGNWGFETALDLQAAHTIAPGAHLLLVVANSASSADLYPAIAYATQHANYVTMSFGAPEGSYVTGLDTTYFGGTASASVSYFASTGDTGSAIEFPATSPHVVAVGGTSLYTNSDYSFSSEQGWASGGGGCSAWFAPPTPQANYAGFSSVGCAGKRGVPDVAMDANPSSGLVIYYSGLTASCTPPNCFWVVGGTSLSSPLFAARAARKGTVVKIADVYGPPQHIKFRDITVGNNGHPCLVGYDLVTGLGSWTGDQ